MARQTQYTIDGTPNTVRDLLCVRPSRIDLKITVTGAAPVNPLIRRVLSVSVGMIAGFLVVMISESASGTVYPFEIDRI